MMLLLSRVSRQRCSLSRRVLSSLSSSCPSSYSPMTTSTTRRRYHDESERARLARQTARPVLFDELESDDELDFSLEETPAAEELYDQRVHNLHEGEEDDEEDSDDEEPRPDMKVGKQLLRLGKVSSRRIEYLPDWVAQRKQEISEHRTPRQVRRCVKNWMLKPDRQLQQEYAFKSVGWGHQAPNKQDNRNSSPKVPTNDKKKNADHSTPFVYGPEETVAYSNFFFPSRFAITQRILKEIKMLMPKYEPKRILDLGCGMGTVGAAAVDVWGASEVTQEARKRNVRRSGGIGGVEKYVGVDPSEAMLDAAKIMTSRMGVLNLEDDDDYQHDRRGRQYSPSSSSRGRKSSSLSSLKNKFGRVDVVLNSKTQDVVKRIIRGGDKERFDMAVVAYTLSELENDEVKKAAVQVLYEALDVNGLLVIVDNGSPIGSHSVRSARQHLLDLFNTPQQLDQHEDENVNMFGKTAAVNYVLPPPTDNAGKQFKYEDFMLRVLAPCTHDQTCPLKPGAWCSFKQKTQSSMVRKASEEKFSYVILQKQLRKKPLHDSQLGSLQDDWTGDPDDVDPGRDPTPLATLNRFLEARNEGEVNDLVENLLDDVDWDDYNPPLYRQEYGRIIRNPLKKKGHVVLDVCQSDGMLTRAVIAKSEVWQIPTLYTALRKLRWGGLVPVLPLDHHHDVDSKVDDGEGNDNADKNTGYSPSSYIAQSPISKKMFIQDPPLKRIVPPPIKVGKRSEIWNEGDGLKKDDRNRNYYGRGGLVMDEKRENSLKDEYFDEEFDSSRLINSNDVLDYDEQRRSGDDFDFENKDDDKNVDLTKSSWDDDSDDDEMFSEFVKEGGLAEDDLPDEKLHEIAKNFDGAVSKLRNNELPKPQDFGKERFFPDEDEGEEHQLSDGSEGGDEVTDMDILNKLRENHSLKSIDDKDLEQGSIPWDKVFADLKEDGVFNDIDMTELEGLEKSMRNLKSEKDLDMTDDEMKQWMSGNGLDMEDFTKMLNEDTSPAPSSLPPPSSTSNKPNIASRRQAVFNDDDDDEEEWTKGVTAFSPGPDVVINSNENGRGKRKELQGLKRLDDLAKKRLENIRDEIQGERVRGRKRRPVVKRTRK